MDASRPLPEALQRLGPLALDLRLSGSKTLAGIWRRLDPEAWDRTSNPHVVLAHASQERLEAAASDPALLAVLDNWFARRKDIEASAGWFGSLPDSRDLAGVAYFSMEFGLSEALPIYSGGLGILAGDHLKSANDLGVPLVGIGLLYQQGYFRQVLGPDGSQLEAYPFNNPGSLPIEPVLDPDGRWPRLALELPGRTLLLRAWQAHVGRVRLYLLDSNHPLNSPWDRGITANLYAAPREQRLLQELVLGFGGYALLERLGLDTQVCHLNEGHAAFAVVARAASFATSHGVPFDVALRATRSGNVFTTHTPVEAAFDRFEPELVLDYAGPLLAASRVAPEDVLALGRRDPWDESEPFNMAFLAARGSGSINGVSRLHGAVSRRLFAGLFPDWPVQEVPVGHVTNGVHVPTWHSEESARLWSHAYGQRRAWLGDLAGAADRMATLSDERLWVYRSRARATLVDQVRARLADRTGIRATVPALTQVLDPNVLTLGFARRFASYKRPWLLFHDAERLAALLRDEERPMQLIVAGKAHPNDQPAKAMVREVARFTMRPDVARRVVFLEDYDMTLAQQLLAGVDVWINNPRRPAEACGTSGMKALVNGGLNCSTLDGWWDEAYDPEVGWAIGDRVDRDADGDESDAEALYDLLEHGVLDEFYDRDEIGVPRRWMARVRASMSTLTTRFSSDRMVREYVETAYLPAARRVTARTRDDGREGAAVESWARRLETGWPTIRFGRLVAETGPAGATIRIEVYLGDVPAESARLQAYADPVESAAEPDIIELTLERPIAGAINGHVFAGALRPERPREDFTIRVLPRHPSAAVPLEASWIRWGPRLSPAPPWASTGDEPEHELVGIPIETETDAEPETAAEPKAETEPEAAAEPSSSDPALAGS